ncbi:MAG: DNA-binding MarR family transcriptional regulator [Gammaproteobacteria bacterium]
MSYFLNSVLYPSGKLTYPQYLVMMALWGKDAVSISEIAQITRIGNATLTPLLKRLEVNGFIERRIVEIDERQKLVVLTNSGKTLAKKAKKASELALCATGLSEKDVNKLMNLCQQIKKNLENL